MNRFLAGAIASFLFACARAPRRLCRLTRESAAVERRDAREMAAGMRGGERRIGGAIGAAGAGAARRAGAVEDAVIVGAAGGEDRLSNEGSPGGGDHELI